MVQDEIPVERVPPLEQSLAQLSVSVPPQRLRAFHITTPRQPDYTVDVDIDVSLVRVKRDDGTIGEPDASLSMLLLIWEARKIAESTSIVFMVGEVESADLQVPGRSIFNNIRLKRTLRSGEVITVCQQRGQANAAEAEAEDSLATCSRMMGGLLGRTLSYTYVLPPRQTVSQHPPSEFRQGIPVLHPIA
jgi:hypothetical protein